MKKIVTTLLIVASLVGCKSIDPYTGEEKVSNTTKGSVGGALAGALVGQLSGKDTKSTIIGGLTGAAIGGGAGYYMDKQEDRLRAELAGSGVGIKRVGEDKLALVMPGNLTFKSSSAAIAPDSYKVLNSISKVLSEYDTTKVSIRGYTDSTGSAEFNRSLSQDRADAVYYYLNGRGVSKTRMNSEGLGESFPIASNETANGRAENRRVEIEIAG